VLGVLALVVLGLVILGAESLPGWLSTSASWVGPRRPTVAAVTGLALLALAAAAGTASRAVDSLRRQRERLEEERRRLEATRSAHGGGTG
jgi:hypothetical protein